MKANDNPFVRLTDELTALRRSVEHLARFSLDKQEAKDLNKTLTQALGKMEHAAQQAPRSFMNALAEDRGQIAQDATQATSEAAERVLNDIRKQLADERLKLAEAAGEARRAAWRSFGGFWVWLTSMLAVGAFLGLLVGQIVQAGHSLFRTSDMVRYTCDWSSVGGEVVEQEDGSSFCLFWIETPTQAEARRQQGS